LETNDPEKKLVKFKPLKLTKVVKVLHLPHSTLNMLLEILEWNINMNTVDPFESKTNILVSKIANITTL
jgi:hypothetical protein